MVGSKYVSEEKCTTGEFTILGGCKRESTKGSERKREGGEKGE